MFDFMFGNHLWWSRINVSCQINTSNKRYEYDMIDTINI